MPGIKNVRNRPEMPDAEYNAWRDFVRGRCGMDFPESRRRSLTSAVRARMLQTGRGDFGDYLRELSSELASIVEWPALLNHLVNNESSFFRHQPSFLAIRDLVIPDLRSRKQASESSIIRAWSAGCSSGEEPFSLAMTFAESFDLEDWQIEVHATDISRRILRRARKALFRPDDLDSLTETQRKRFLEKVETPAGTRYTFEKGLREMVRFREHNLCDVSGLTPMGFDVIFCQNLLIYFDEPTRRDVYRRMCNALNPGGYLFLGPAELIGARWEYSRQVEFPETSIHQRIA